MAGVNITHVIILPLLLRHPNPHPDMVLFPTTGLEFSELFNVHRLAIYQYHLLTPVIIVVQRRDLAFRAPEICVCHYSSLLIAYIALTTNYGVTTFYQ